MELLAILTFFLTCFGASILFYEAFKGFSPNNNIHGSILITNIVVLIFVTFV